VYEADAAGGKRAGKMIFAVPCGRDLTIKTDSKTTYIKFTVIRKPWLEK